MNNSPARVHYGEAPVEEVQDSKVEMGEPFQHDPNFNGIEQNRKCTDLFMCIIFLVFICGMLALFIFVYPMSNPKYLYIPTDHRGLICGFDNRKVEIDGFNSSVLPDLSDKPYLFWTRPGKMGFSRSICVKKCPEDGLFEDAFNLAISNTAYFPDGLAENTNCGTDPKSVQATLRNYSSTSTTDGYFCPYATFLLAMRCFPSKDSLPDSSSSSAADITSNLQESFKSIGVMATMVSDVLNSWKVIIYISLASIILSGIWLLLLRFLAGFFVWLSVLLSVGALAGLTYLTYVQKNNGFNNAATAEAYTLGFYSASVNQKLFSIFFWILVAIDVIFALVLLFLCDRIKLSIGIIKIVSRVFSNVWSLFFFPVIVYVLIFIWWAYVAYVAIVLFGAGNPEYGYDETRQLERVNYVYSNPVKYMSIYHFFGFLWVTMFIVALSEMAAAGVFSSYYFSREPRRQNMGRAPLWRSFWRSVRYHTGSLAIGSLIIAICKFIRACLEYIDRKTKGTQSTAVAWLLKCLKCCFWLLEKFLKYLNRNVYIMISIHGESFYKSMVKSFQLILRNIVRVATINWVGDFTLFLGRVFVSAAATGASLYVFMNMVEDVTFFFVPACFVFVLSYLASGVFTNIFEIGIDSMFLCFMEDEERNDGTAEKPYFAPPEVRERLHA